MADSSSVCQLARIGRDVTSRWLAIQPTGQRGMVDRLELCSSPDSQLLVSSDSFSIQGYPVIFFNCLHVGLANIAAMKMVARVDTSVSHSPRCRIRMWGMLCKLVRTLQSPVAVKAYTVKYYPGLVTSCLTSSLGKSLLLRSVCWF